MKDLEGGVAFVSIMASDPWGGSEELWSRAALDLVAQGIPVSACVAEWSPLHPRMLELEAQGVELWLRPTWYSRRRHPWRWVTARRRDPMVFEAERMLAARRPALVAISYGGAFPSIRLLEMCISQRVPFVTISQGDWEGAWYADEYAARFRAAAAAAARCYFVSHTNRWLTEKQIGGEIANAEVVWNPFNVSFDAAMTWPPLDEAGGLRFACVARLDPPSKGQDVLFEALAGPSWKERAWKLYLYGEGPMRQSLEWLARKLGIAERVVFAGFAAVQEIWAANHVLVMPSRFEGMPLAMLEAMLCGRPVVATDVAGHSEIIEDGVTGFLADAPTRRSMDAALERFWERRNEAEQMGKLGAHRIRELVPPDPAKTLSDKLKRLAGLTGAS
jgi:glycosyltransferase involved in cell wall biosynthesis